MSLILIILCGCIIFALVRSSEGCKKCCGSCTRPKIPSCPDLPNPSQANALYFPKEGTKMCTAVSKSQCKGKFYTNKNECESCCKSFFK
uniref:Putative kunitz n=1 Tax=Rhipicephalus microplus TaxID=6941 RepID=A0A6G5A2E8_RHIMP